MNYRDLKVLIIDDDDSTLEVLSALTFKHFNIDSLLAFSAENAFEIMKSIKPDLIILDLQMPQINGYNFLAEIRSDEKLKDIAVVTCTALGHKELIISICQLGIEDYILKPIIPSLFINKIQKVLDKLLRNKINAEPIKN